MFLSQRHCLSLTLRTHNGGNYEMLIKILLSFYHIYIYILILLLIYIYIYIYIYISLRTRKLISIFHYEFISSYYWQILRMDLYIHICTHMYTHTHTYTHIYIYVCVWERERERERKRKNERRELNSTECTKQKGKRKKDIVYLANRQTIKHIFLPFFFYVHIYKYIYIGRFIYINTHTHIYIYNIYIKIGRSTMRFVFF